jgi:hypothetical protein
MGRLVSRSRHTLALSWRRRRGVPEVNRWSLREAEQRWPEFTSLAEEMGLRSYLSAGLGIADGRSEP